MKKEDILEFLRINKNKMHERFGVTKIGLFGSYARNENSQNSDIDILVELKSDNKFRNFFNLLYYLREHLNNDIDLGIESSLKPIAKKNIKQEVIYA